MTKRLIPLLAFLFCAFFVHAQKPQTVTRTTSINGSTAQKSVGSIIGCADQDAGDVQAGSFSGDSNDNDFPTVYLCWGDEINIDHIAGTSDLTGDPDLGTTAGIGYGFYSSMPTISGPNLDAILLDPAIITNPPTPPGVEPIWITFGDIAGNATFTNDGAAQTFFNGGDPVEIFFAPITVDDFGIGNFEDGALGTAGPCTNVSIDQAFSVIYLNEIVISNEVLNGTTGAFDIVGGFPEIENSNYTVVIENVAVPGMMGTITNGTVMHDDNVQFSVPEEGTYKITATDEKGCMVMTEVVGVPCSSIEVVFGEIVIAPDGLGCISVVSNNFDQMLSLQFTMTYDPAVITFNSVTNLNTALAPQLSIASFGTPPTMSIPAGNITFSWFEIGGATLPDGSVLFDLCFDGAGDAGDLTSFMINENPGAPTPSEAANTTSPSAIPICQTPSVIAIGNLVLTPVVIPADCFGNGTGAIDFTVAGGNPPYTYTYQNLAVAADMGGGAIVADGGMDNIPNLIGGQQYQIIVLDSTVPDPEPVMETLLITSPPEIAGQLAELNPVCAGDSTGNVQLTVIYDGSIISLPDPDFSLLWNTGDTTPSIGNLPAGGYNVVITHLPTGCTTNSPVGTILANPSPIEPGLSSTIATCAGFLNGSVTAAPTGGSAPYLYNWDNPDITNVNLPSSDPTVNGLDPGMYYVTITDNSGSGCAHMDSILVGATTIIQSGAFITDVSCFGAQDGGINITPTAIGTNNGGYSFNWNDLPTGMNTEDRAMIEGMTYELTITDAMGCVLIESYDVVEPDQILITLDDTTNESCVVGMDGSATVSVVGGVGNLMYDWGTTPNQTTPTATDLFGGIYTVTVSDDNMCEDSLVVTILPPVLPLTMLPDTSLLDCSTSVDGSLTVTVSSASQVQSYQWSTGGTTDMVSNLGIGTYFVTVTTEDGCAVVDTAVIASPNPITLDTSFVQDIPDCPGVAAGTISIIPQGGTAPYSYQWSTDFVGINPTLSQLVGDTTYCVTITDANACESLEACIFLPDPPSIVATFIDTEMITCNNGITCDGAATVLVSGGTGGNDYTFTWDSNETDSIASALCTGLNSVTISDGDCGIIETVEIGAPDPILVDLASIVRDEPTCFGDSDGGISLNATGGIPTYDYLWDTGSTDNFITGVPAGSYSVQITDANDCQTQNVIALGQPDSLIATVDGFGTADAICFGDNDGSISVIWSGGNSGPATYQWTNNVSNGPTASELPIGSYNITVTDVNGCSDTTQHTINQPSPIIVEIPEPMEPECFGFQTFITLDTVYGGNPGLYTYSVDNGPQQLVNAAIPVFADLTHTISIFDSEGCRLDTMLFINQPDEVIVNLGPDIEIQLGDSVRLQSLPVSSLPIDTFYWSPPVALSCVNCFEPWSAPLSTQAYTFTIEDVNGCSGSDDIVVEVDKNRNIYLPNVFSPNGDGFNDIFKIESGPGVVNVNFMYIFDRWGEQMYARENFIPGDDIISGWDGNFNGDEAPSGVYVYIVEVNFADGIQLLYRGDITIIR